MKTLMNDWIKIYLDSLSSEELYWAMAILNCHWSKIDDVLLARRNENVKVNK